MQHGWSTLTTSEDAPRAVSRLERDGRVLGVERPAAADGGRPTVDYWINPLVRRGGWFMKYLDAYLAKYGVCPPGNIRRGDHREKGHLSSLTANPPVEEPAKPAKPSLEPARDVLHVSGAAHSGQTPGKSHVAPSGSEQPIRPDGRRGPTTCSRRGRGASIMEFDDRLARHDAERGAARCLAGYLTGI